MKINKYYFDCIFGPLLEKTYDIPKEDLPYYILLNKSNKYTSYIKYSDKEELLLLNPEYHDYIETVFNQDDNIH